MVSNLQNIIEQQGGALVFIYATVTGKPGKGLIFGHKSGESKE
jgi:hypothetical protein